MSGQVRVRGKGGGKYPFHYLEMIDYVFGEENTIEVCSGSINEGCFTVDINQETYPRAVDDGQTLAKIPSNKFCRWRCDPPYNKDTARKMYGTFAASSWSYEVLNPYLILIKPNSDTEKYFIL
jgi:hypothetical protein